MARYLIYNPTNGAYYAEVKPGQKFQIIYDHYASIYDDVEWCFVNQAIEENKPTTITRPNGEQLQLNITWR